MLGRLRRVLARLRPSCGSLGMLLYVYFGGKRLPICWRCWREMVESGLQWSENSPEGEVNEEVERVKNAMVRCILIETLSKMAEREALEK